MQWSLSFVVTDIAYLWQKFAMQVESSGTSKHSSNTDDNAVKQHKQLKIFHSS